MTTQDDQEYLTVNEAVQMLGVTRKTLDRYVEEKRIIRYRRGIGRTFFFKRADVEALLEIRPEDQVPE